MSKFEDDFEVLLISNNLITYHREWVFHEPAPGEKQRRFRFDFAWPDERVAAECEGGTWISGRHNHPSSIEKDMEKYNLAAEQGWTVLRYTPGMIKKDPEAITTQIWACLIAKSP